MSTNTMICIQCSMKAMLNNEAPPSFDETPEEHVKRCHPDLEAARKERQELMLKLDAKLKKEGRYEGR
jgi:hypothetical protein